MRWKISHHDPDPRQIDLLAVVVLILTIAVAWFYFAHQPEATTTVSFIVPSQSVHW